MDVNVYIYAYRKDVTDHLAYREWLGSVINSDEFFDFSDLALSGFLRVVTHPKVFSSPTPLCDALEFTEQISTKSNAVNVYP
jgi:predicted nucleic acid-binding protein